MLPILGGFKSINLKLLNRLFYVALRLLYDFCFYWLLCMESSCKFILSLILQVAEHSIGVCVNVCIHHVNVFMVLTNDDF